MKTTKELFEDGSLLIRDYKGHEQMLMNEGTFIAIVDETIDAVKNNIVLPDVSGQLPPTDDEIIGEATEIDAPKDKDGRTIFTYAYNDDEQDAFITGAKWMRNKLVGGNFR